MSWIEIVLRVISPLIALAALLWTLVWTWQEHRRKELRRDDILSWANQAIQALQETVLICTLTENAVDREQLRQKAFDLIFATSVLAEQGRIFFKNVVQNKWGAEKPAAYRGYRPEVLDHLVVAHQIACAWASASPQERRSMCVVAVDRLRRFVTVIQCEVGRERTASIDTATAGHGIDLQALLQKAGQPRLTKEKSWL